MEERPCPPDNARCPGCGAANALDSEFCGACYAKLRPKQVSEAAAAEKNVIQAPAAQTEPMEEPRPASRLWGRVVLLTCLAFFYCQWLLKDNYFSPLDFVNLAFHEAGHIFLGFFGRFIMMLGGTIFQLLIPAVCLVHLLRRGANLGWQLCLFWLGENLLNISIYAGDALKQDLPLVGGGEHDWTYLLTETGLIAHTDGVARVIFMAGSAIIFLSFYFIARDAAAREPIDLGNAPPGLW